MTSKTENLERDLMAPDTDPTDEELHLVMHEALNLALERKQLSDAWMRQRLNDEVKSILQQHATLTV